MAVDALVLATNPGSSSRKYALYQNDKYLASLHFEYENGRIVCTLITTDKTEKLYPSIEKLEETPELILPILKTAGFKIQKKLSCIGLRMVAPTEHFLKDRLLDVEALEELIDLEQRVPLHIRAMLQEAKRLQHYFANTPIAAISDSAFHITKPDYAWNYAIPLQDADRLEIKRFGYHGISLASVVRELSLKNKLPAKLIVCHLGSGASVTAILDGKSLDTTMGYSPLEGLMMATRSGSIDIVAADILKKGLNMDMADFEAYLNKESGLKGISGFSSDIRELIAAEDAGDYRAGLALRMYAHRVRQAIGQMAASLDGVDTLVFTGTVGDRSFIMRKRIVDGLSHLGLAIDENKNQAVIEPSDMQIINLPKRKKHIYVITTDESREIALRAVALVEASNF